MNEQFARVNDQITLCYETFGDASDPTVLLVMGLGTQMIAWHDEFCEQLAARGFHVVRFDNRDCGRSTHLTGRRPPTLLQMARRDRSAAHYLLEDFAADAVGLLDELGVERAHIVGASMGGMIAQTVAARHPDRVLSLVSIMSNTGSRWSGQPAFTVYPLFLKAPPREREAYAAHMERLFGVIGSTGFEHDPAEFRQMMELGMERAPGDAAATGRQLQAILASGDRSAELRRIRVPALVIHGTADKLVRPSGGRATARAIPGARLMMIDGMGHDLPRGAWPQIIDGIADTAQRATAAAAPAAT